MSQEVFVSGILFMYGYCIPVISSHLTYHSSQVAGQYLYPNCKLSEVRSHIQQCAFVSGILWNTALSFQGLTPFMLSSTQLDKTLHVIRDPLAKAELFFEKDHREKQMLEKDKVSKGGS